MDIAVSAYYSLYIISFVLFPMLQPVYIIVQAKLYTKNGKCHKIKKKIPGIIPSDHRQPLCSSSPCDLGSRCGSTSKLAIGGFGVSAPQVWELSLHQGSRYALLFLAQVTLLRGVHLVSTSPLGTSLHWEKVI